MRLTNFFWGGGGESEDSLKSHFSRFGKRYTFRSLRNVVWASTTEISYIQNIMYLELCFSCTYNIRKYNQPRMPHKTILPKLWWLTSKLLIRISTWPIFYPIIRCLHNSEKYIIKELKCLNSFSIKMRSKYNEKMFIKKLVRGTWLLYNILC